MIKKLGLTVFALCAGLWPCAGAEPVHTTIDVQVAAGAKDYAKNASPTSSDSEFLRRITLDLTGTIPAPEQVRAFLKDPSADKRAKVIDQLLASPGYARHMGYIFDNLYMDRRPGKFVPPGEWLKFLTDSFAAGKPFDALVREILSNDGSDAKTRAAARFLLDRDAEPNQVTRDISRVFLGMNLTCCQCHDHPLVPAYKQDHYYGLLAFVSRSQVVPDARPVALGEKADGETTFTSVFDPSKAIKTASLRVPFGSIIAEPKMEKGKEYKVAPAKGVRGVPNFSRRSQLPAALTSSRQFARNTANRLWSIMMGRGIVHPVEFDHKANPPSHPELLDKLTDALIEKKFDVRYLLKEIALSQTYQRSSERVGDKEPEPERYLTASLKAMTPEQLAWALMTAAGLPDAQKTDAQVRTFVATFGGKPGEPDAGFQATLDQTLFVANGPLLRQWLTPAGTNLTGRLVKLTDPAAVADELFISVLSRRPDAGEIQLVSDYLKGRTADRPAALQELAWALLASAEFRFCH